MRIENLDHLVLTVKNIKATCAFYSQMVLGMEIVALDGGRTALSFGGQRINLHQQEGRCAAPEPRVRSYRCTSATRT